MLHLEQIKATATIFHLRVQSRLDGSNAITSEGAGTIGQFLVDDKGRIQVWEFNKKRGVKGRATTSAKLLSGLIEEMETYRQ